MISTTMHDYRAFAAAAARRPALVGACAPSSRRLGDLLATVVPGTGAPVVAELGPGTGSVSHAIAARLPAAGTHLAVELDPALAAHLRARLPGITVVEGDAADLGPLLATAGLSDVDAVVSGLPWALFPPEQQRRTLAAIAGCLPADGAFSTFTYRHTGLLSAARRFRRLLHEHFDQVVCTRTVWRNLPPAFAYVCHRPLCA